jgi:hypothetical protein
LVVHFWKYDNPEDNEAGDEGTLLVDLDAGKEIAVLDGRSILFSKDGQTVATISSRQDLVIRYRHTGAGVKLIPREIWSRRGSCIVWADQGAEESWQFLENRKTKESADGKWRASQSGHNLAATHVDQGTTYTITLATHTFRCWHSSAAC